MLPIKQAPYARDHLCAQGRRTRMHTRMRQVSDSGSRVSIASREHRRQEPRRVGMQDGQSEKLSVFTGSISSATNGATKASQDADIGKLNRC